jgi:hypothetical protein
MVNSTAPSQIRIALAGAHDMTVSYTTLGSTISTVNFGTVPTNLSEVIGDVPASSYIEPFFHHHVTLTGLQPGTKYYYQCGNAKAGTSQIFQFTTSPDVAKDASFSASIFGDWGYGINGKAVATREALETIRTEVDLLLHLGDIGIAKQLVPWLLIYFSAFLLAYADDSFLHDKTSFGYENVYNAWMQWIQNISSSIPYGKIYSFEMHCFESYLITISCACVRVCVCARVRLCVCVCVCVSIVQVHGVSW